MDSREEGLLGCGNNVSKQEKRPMVERVRRGTNTYWVSALPGLTSLGPFISHLMPQNRESFYSYLLYLFFLFLKYLFIWLCQMFSYCMQELVH